ncbi:hypothetical protein SLS56_012204 [Neofusicoccum ribis]|uniref:Uncharacterized protein n=1 Tax=Neofusicoccum ribis TaxID=45134 RepID=A0ABR3S9H2_9PEZI
MTSRQAEIEARLSRARRKLSQKAQEVKNLEEELRVEEQRARKKRMYDEFMEKPTASNGKSSEKTYLPSALDDIIKKLEEEDAMIHEKTAWYKNIKCIPDDLIASPTKPIPFQLFTEGDLSAFSELKKCVDYEKKRTVNPGRHRIMSIETNFAAMSTKTIKDYWSIKGKKIEDVE